jgi:hypothetical protein
MFGPKPLSVDTKNSNAKYEELIFYLYDEYKKHAGGQGTRPVADVSQDQLGNPKRKA